MGTSSRVQYIVSMIDKPDMMPTPYRLSHYIITQLNDELIAHEYFFIANEGVIREINHPAVIDESNSVLVIKGSSMQGKDTDYTAESLLERLSGIPAWDITLYYQVIDNLCNKMYLCKSGIPVHYSR